MFEYLLSSGLPVHMSVVLITDPIAHTIFAACYECVCRGRSDCKIAAYQSQQKQHLKLAAHLTSDSRPAPACRLVSIFRISRAASHLD